MMTGRKLLRPPLLALAPQSDHGRAACAETEAFFQYGPPQSFFELSWLALQKARAREVGATMMTGREFLCPPSYGSFRNPITGVPRARKLKLFSNMARRNPLPNKLARPTKSTSGSWRNDWLAPQSDHGSAACAETEAFFQYGPPQSFFELSWLALQKARGREVGARTDDRAQFLSPPSYGSFRNPITGVPRARKLKLFSNMARRNPFSN